MPDRNKTEPKAWKNPAVRRSGLDLPKGTLSEFNVFKATGAASEEFRLTNRLAIVVENEILLGEHSDQVVRYPAFDPLCIFLTPSGDMPSHSGYVPGYYGVVYGKAEAIVGERILPGRDDLEYPAPHPSGVSGKHGPGSGAPS
jgi:hypothetical protein